MTKKFDSIKSEIGHVITINRKLKGYSQSEFAHVIGISERALSKIENGYNYPSLYNTSLINEFLDISISEIIKNSSNDPNLHINMLYSQFLFYLDNRDSNKLKSIYRSMHKIAKNVDLNPIQYKKYLFTQGWYYILTGEIIKSFEILDFAYRLNASNTKENKILDYKIFLLKESIAPDLQNSKNEIDRVAYKSINNLKEKSKELDNYPELKMKYLYNMLVIKIGNLEDYTPDRDLLNSIIDLSIDLNHDITYYQTIFYRGLIQYYNDYSFFHLDINEALTYFYVKKNYSFFDTNVELLKRTILYDNM